MKKAAIFMYEGSPVFEVAIASYILNTKYEIDIILDGKDSIVTTEGITIRKNKDIANAELCIYDALIICGGEVESIKQLDKLKSAIKAIDERDGVIAAICAGRKIVKEALNMGDIDWTKTATYKKRLVFSPANEYAAFGIEVGKCLDIYKDEDDYIETIDFFIPKMQ